MRAPTPEEFERGIRQQAAKMRAYVQEAENLAKATDKTPQQALEAMLKVHVQKSLVARGIAKRMASAYMDSADRLHLAADTMRREPLLSVRKVVDRLALLEGNLRTTAAAIMREAEASSEAPPEPESSPTIVKPGGDRHG